jgi:glutamine amidotransferase
MRDTVVIVDYDMGNIRSIQNKINRAGFNVSVSCDLKVIDLADKLILPGVGHFANGMKKLREKNLLDILNRKVLYDKTPILGICLGMQLLTRHSEEGDADGLGWIDAETIRFRLNDIRTKVPHIGWNSIDKKKNSPLLENIPELAQFYFVHSFYVKCNNPENILATSVYGYEFVSAVQKENICGTQFHPEKSHDQGEMLLRNFLRW